MDPTQIYDISTQLLHRGGYISSEDRQSILQAVNFSSISADGSLRNFFRIEIPGRNSCVGVFPHCSSAEGHAEAVAAASIGRHLHSRNVPVPRILGWDEQSGLILFEDCGDTRLHDLLNTHAAEGQPAEISAENRQLYRDLIATLCHMQIEGAAGFDVKWCYDTPYYDKDIMVNREANYFLQAFWYELLGGGSCAGIDEEFSDLANKSLSGDCNYFLHRDFQSRNIMVCSGKIMIIDFQGGRLGPLAYDLASVLVDPYSRLPEAFQHDLLQHYFRQLSNRIKCNYNEFILQYSYVALFRNLQILGAFAFLYKRRKKKFFKQFLAPALFSLQKHLKDQQFNQYTVLKKITDSATAAVRNI